MVRKTDYLRHLPNSEALITTYEATRAGFIALALEKNRFGTPVIDEARAVKAIANKAANLKELIRIAELRPALLKAAGVSKKAEAFMEDVDKKDAISEFVEKYLEPAGPAFVEELVFRFLLTKGDELGGQIRNIAGILGRLKLSRAVISSLNVKGHEYSWLNSESGAWSYKKPTDTEIEDCLKGVAWGPVKRQRSLVFNVKVPLVGKMIDVILLNSKVDNYRGSIARPACYVALGELKGGIDPAGADEHWKTARAALSRIRTSFSREELNPDTFFIGAAIVASMAREIWEQLRTKTLTNAANLTNPDQLASLCDWLTAI